MVGTFFVKGGGNVSPRSIIPKHRIQDKSRIFHLDNFERAIVTYNFRARFSKLEFIQHILPFVPKLHVITVANKSIN